MYKIFHISFPDSTLMCFKRTLELKFANDAKLHILQMTCVVIATLACIALIKLTGIRKFSGQSFLSISLCSLLQTCIFKFRNNAVEEGVRESTKFQIFSPTPNLEQRLTRETVRLRTCSSIRNRLLRSYSMNDSPLARRS